MKTLIAALAAVMILIPAIASTQQCRILQQAEELELTDQQIEQLQAASLAAQKEMVQPRADLQKAKLEMKEIMQAKQIDKNKALAKQKQISEIKSLIAQKKLASRIDRLSILNEQQRAKVRKDMMLRGPGHRGPEGERHMRDCGFGPDMSGDRIEKRIMRRFSDTPDDKVIILEKDIEIEEDN